MGKRLEDLDLTDPPRPLNRLVVDFCGEIDELVANDDFTWALDTLLGIRQTVERYQAVTEGQRWAVANIAAAHWRPDGGRRRYEGFSRRGR